MCNYDLLVIGAGPGGYTAALHAARLGLKTAVAEKQDVGGTCLNRGCIPTKTLLHTAELAQGALTGELFGVHVQGVSVNFAAAHARKNQVVQQLRQGIETLFQQKKVDLLRGNAVILAPGKAEVAGNIYTARAVLIATGSVPARPPIPGLEYAVTSDELLEDQDKVYSSLVIIGGGVIGMELASLYNALHCKVTVLEAMDRIVPGMDREISQNLSMILKKKGIDIFPSAQVTAITLEENGERTVQFVRKGETCTVSAQAVLCAVGRRPYTQGLFGDGLSPAMEQGRILVDETFQTSIPGIYAVGDVVSRIQLAHAAAAQGTACVERLAGKEPSADLSLIPGCVYTSPEIACTGMTAEQAKAQGIDAVSGKYVMFSNGRTVICSSPRGFIKVLVHRQTGVILGAQLMCERATDMISQFTAAIANKQTAAQMLRAVRPHPTFEEGVGQALEDVQSKLAKKH